MTVHIIGAGLAGLSAAVRLSEKGPPVVVHEAASHGGGRCRSFYDVTLERRIDNGNHMLLSGNRQAMVYLNAIGALDSLYQPEQTAFPFLDLENGAHWKVRPRFNPLPGVSFLDYFAVFKLVWASENATVADVLKSSRPVFRNFWEPFCVSVLNTPVEAAAARLLWPVIKQTFGRGVTACCPGLVKQGLSESFIDPAIAVLEKRGVRIHFNQRLRAIKLVSEWAGGLSFNDAEVVLGADDTVILAVPPETAAGLLKELNPPDKFRAIINAHFLLPAGVLLPVEVDESHFLGLVGGVSQWLFIRGDVASVTVSAADDLAGERAIDIARILWTEVCLALELGALPLGRHRIIKEKRATIEQSPGQVRLRPKMRTRWSNLLLAGDWTQTGLPATIEGAVTSGHLAADAIFKGRSGL
jgi:squalene-associated FAD-dependent desaturase